MSICIVAENVSKRFGGEAILPYHYFRVLRSRGIDVRLVTHARTRVELETLFPNDLERLLFVEDLLLHKLFFRISLWLPRRISEATFGLANQMLTQFCQRTIVRRLVREEGVRVVHQPIPVSPRFPSLIWGLGAPVVIGPLNGGMEYPPAFRSIESSFSRFAVAVGRSFSNTVNALLLGKRDAAVVLVANQRTREALPSGLRGKVIEFAENGVELTRWSDFSSPAAIAPIAAIGAGATTLYQRFLFMGRLVDWKALDIAIRAIERTPGAMLDVVGDGPMLGHWKSLAQEIRVADRVLFHGWQPQEECARKLSQSLALVLPSIYECGGAVVLEAMASGKPVIATRWGGPADYLDESCGILIDPDGPEALIAGFARAMQTLMASPQLCASLGAAGRQRVVRDFDWEKKVDRILQIYESVAPELAVVQPAL